MLNGGLFLLLALACTAYAPFEIRPSKEVVYVDHHLYFKGGADIELLCNGKVHKKIVQNCSNNKMCVSSKPGNLSWNCNGTSYTWKLIPIYENNNIAKVYVDHGSCKNIFNGDLYFCDQYSALDIECKTGCYELEDSSLSKIRNLTPKYEESFQCNCSSTTHHVHVAMSRFKITTNIKQAPLTGNTYLKVSTNFIPSVVEFKNCQNTIKYVKYSTSLLVKNRCNQSEEVNVIVSLHGKGILEEPINLPLLESQSENTRRVCPLNGQCEISCVIRLLTEEKIAYIDPPSTEWKKIHRVLKTDKVDEQLAKMSYPCRLKKYCINPDSNPSTRDVTTEKIIMTPLDAKNSSVIDVYPRLRQYREFHCINDPGVNLTDVHVKWTFTGKTLIQFYTRLNSTFIFMRKDMLRQNISCEIKGSFHTTYVLKENRPPGHVEWQIVDIKDYTLIIKFTADMYQYGGEFDALEYVVIRLIELNNKRTKRTAKLRKRNDGIYRMGDLQDGTNYSIRLTVKMTGREISISHTKYIHCCSNFDRIVAVFITILIGILVIYMI